MSNGFEGDPPIVTALITCDQVNVSVDATRKLSLIGIYDALWPPLVPFQYPVTVYASVTGFDEPFRLSIRIICPADSLTSTGALFGERQIDAQRAPADTSQVVLQGIYTFVDFGRYDFQVYGNGAFLASRAVFVRNQAEMNR